MTKIKLGLGITTTNPEKYMSYLKVWDGLILFNTDQDTIARDKNKLIKQLYNLGATHLVLCDDDTFPIKEGWVEWLVGLDVDHYVLNEQIPGCFLLLTREVVEQVGYMNTEYGKYGWEHLGYYRRILNSGLSVGHGMGWKDYIYSYDLQGTEHGFEKIEWQTESEKEVRSLANKPIFEKEIASDQIYYPYDQVVPKAPRTTKMKVLYMYAYENDAIFYYRMAVLQYINHPLIEITRGYYGGDITWGLLHRYDVLILERPTGTHDIALIKLAKQVGLKVIVDFDDDLLSIDNYNPTYAIYQGCKENIMEALYQADEVWVATEGIKKSFSMFNSRVVVVPNAHNNYIQPVEKKKAFNRTSKKAVWRGSHSHEADVYAHSSDIVEIVNENKDWNFYFIGDRFIYLQLQCGENYWPVSMMPLMQYFESMYKANPNLVFHPLRDTDFNKSKSNIAWLESSFAGAAFFGNKRLPEFSNDYICDFDTLGENINDFELERANVGSWQYICENLLLSKINELRIERLLDI